MHSSVSSSVQHADHIPLSGAAQLSNTHQSLASLQSNSTNHFQHYNTKFPGRHTVRGHSQIVVTGWILPYQGTTNKSPTELSIRPDPLDKNVLLRLSHAGADEPARMCDKSDHSHWPIVQAEHQTACLGRHGQGMQENCRNMVWHRRPIIVSRLR